MTWSRSKTYRNVPWKCAEPIEGVTGPVFGRRQTSSARGSANYNCSCCELSQGLAHGLAYAFLLPAAYRDPGSGMVETEQTKKMSTRDQCPVTSCISIRLRHWGGGGADGAPRPYDYGHNHVTLVGGQATFG